MMSKKEIIRRFEALRREVEKKYPGVSVALCELLGRRWSFVCGSSSDTLSPFARRIKVNDRYGISIFDNNVEDEERFKNILAIIKGYFDGDK
ncbi:hypothetical protein [Desulfurobacterium sp.]